MAVTVTVTNATPQHVSGPVADLPNGGGFLYEGRLYIKFGVHAFCPENGAENGIHEFTGMTLPWRDVEYKHAAEITE